MPGIPQKLSRMCRRPCGSTLITQPGTLYILGQAYYLRKGYHEAEKALVSSITRNPKFMPARAYHAAVYWELGQLALDPEEARAFQEKAAAEMGEIRKVIPKPPTERKGTTPFNE